MKAAMKSSFIRLAHYITDTQSKQHRLQTVLLTNCSSLTVEDAALEIAATQAQNVRAQGDKTYHLLVSFRAGEKPDAETLKSIETRICDGLGFAEHQRLSAVHTDTDNLHIHIAINKIHPEKKTLLEPYYQHFTLASLAVQLEAEFSLERDNHQVYRTVSEGRAADMEQHSGLESLISWIRSNCLLKLKEAKSWDEFEATLSKNGLLLVARGNGFVIEAENGIQVKASTVDRSLSKPHLIEKLGTPLKPMERHTAIGCAKIYTKAPTKFKVDTTALYERFKQERQSCFERRKEGRAQSRTRFDKALSEAKQRAKRRRATIKLLGKGRDIKRLLHSQVSAALKRELESIRQDQHLNWKQLSDQARSMTWADWLRDEAVNGNSTALAALRAREGAAALRGNTLNGTGTGDQLKNVAVDTVTKKGSIIYRVGQAAIRDDGNRLQVSKEASNESVQSALQMAVQRYGKKINVNGSIAFKAKVILAASDLRLDIQFSDPLLELKRRQLLDKRVSNGQTGSISHAASESGSAVRTSISNARQQLANGRSKRASPQPDQISRATAAAADGNRKPDIARVGTSPPPFRRNRLCSLSELGMVHHIGGAELLLPRDVPHHVDAEKATGDTGMRRNPDWAGTGLVQDSAAAKADQYIAEREEKRQRGLDIEMHSRYTFGSETTTFQGIRNVDGQPLALLKRSKTIMVTPISEAAVLRLSKMGIGTEVKMSTIGPVRAKKVNSR